MNIWERRHQNVTKQSSNHGYYNIITVGCCIYHKSRQFGESSSSDDSDDDKCGCHEHRVAKKKMKRTQK